MFYFLPYSIFFIFRLMNAYGLYTSLGCNVLMVEYRGYGKSHGTPSEMGKCTTQYGTYSYLKKVIFF